MLKIAVKRFHARHGLEPDGVIGAKTRSAIRAYQAKSGLPADGYAGQRLLRRLREDTPR